MSLTREFYKKVLQGSRPDEAKIDDTIGAAEDFKNLLQTSGYKRLKRFIDTQRLGSQQYLQKESSSISLFSFPWLFNTFIKYIAVLLENRAYDRIETYINVTIQKGEQYAKERAKREEKHDTQSLG